MHEFAGWLEHSHLAEVIRQDLWLYPVVEIVHLMGVVLLVGSVMMFDIRILGSSKDISVKKISRHLLPWSYGGLGIILPSGFLLFMTNATALVNDPVFQIKLSLIVLGGLNALFFNRLASGSVHQWDRYKPAPLSLKVMAGISLFIWVTVICCGGLLAY